MRFKQILIKGILLLILALIMSWGYSGNALSNDLKGIKNRGVLRHLGVTYAHFVKRTPKGYKGLDVELMKLFAAHLGVEYQLVNTTWETIFTDLTGRKKIDDQTFHLKQTEKIKGDIIANGLTILPWRQKIVAFSRPTFPTGVWLIASAHSTLKPIKPSGDIKLDIHKVKSLLNDRTVLAMDGTCLDASLYDLHKTNAKIKYYTQTKLINDIAPAMINGMAETTLLDVPDAMVALQSWPGEIKIIGPISQPQRMGIAVNKSSFQLLEALDTFFIQIWADGTYRSLVEKYYPSIFLYFENFFTPAKS